MSRHRRFAALALAGCAVAAAAIIWLTWPGGKNTPTPGEEFNPVRQALPATPTVTFPIKSAREADDLLNPAELALGVVVEGEARAYPVSRLNAAPAQKVLNDTLGGRAIAAVW